MDDYLQDAIDDQLPLTRRTDGRAVRGMFCVIFVRSIIPFTVTIFASKSRAQQMKMFNFCFGIINPLY